MRGRVQLNHMRGRVQLRIIRLGRGLGITESGRNCFVVKCLASDCIAKLEGAGVLKFALKMYIIARNSILKPFSPRDLLFLPCH